MRIIDRTALAATCWLVLFVASSGCRRQIDAPLPIAVQVITLKREAVSSETRFTATVRELQRIELSFKVPGTLAAMLQVPGFDGKQRDLHEGDEVRADASRPLARLDDSDYQRRREMARDRLAQAKARQEATEGHGDGGTGELRAHEGPSRARVGGTAGVRGRVGSSRLGQCRAGGRWPRGFGRHGCPAAGGRRLEELRLSLCRLPKLRFPRNT